MHAFGALHFFEQNFASGSRVGLVQDAPNITFPIVPEVIGNKKVLDRHVVLPNCSLDVSPTPTCYVSLQDKVCFLQSH